MMIRVREGRVTHIVDRDDDVITCMVAVDGEEQPAVAYTALTGDIRIGFNVALNTTAHALSLGTGGVHFIQAVWGQDEDAATLGGSSSLNRASAVDRLGHIMKVRYTPSQVKVLCAEETVSPVRAAMERIPDLDGLPVLVGTVHSQVPVVAAAIRSLRPGAQIAYCMTDGGALPVAFSRLIKAMKKHGLIKWVISTGHAFGGDYETVNVPSALALAKAGLQADVVIVCMGPGVVGTGTPLGTTALEQGPILSAAASLGGTPLPIVRMSFSEARPRHLGISHHVMTVLTRFVNPGVAVALPLSSVGARGLDGLGTVHTQEVVRQQADELARAGHRIVWVDSEPVYEKAASMLRDAKINVTTMGRTDVDDPVFFHAATAAAMTAFL